jgi:hypothetical protein
MKNVVLAYDGSQSALPALKRVAEMAPADVSVIVVCAVETLIRSRVPTAPLSTQ